MAACGDELSRDGDLLTIRAALPIDELEPSRYRAPVLLVDGERFVLQSKEGDARRPLYRLRQIDEANAYEPEGKVLSYDGERHLERRRARRRTALAWVLWIPTVPLLPIIGLLPESWKEKLVQFGVDPGRASRLSLGLEWMLVAVLMIAYPFLVFTWPGLLVGAAALFTAADIAYRVTADSDQRAPGAFALAGALATWVKDLLAKEPQLLSDEERTTLLGERPRHDRDLPLSDDREPPP